MAERKIRVSLEDLISPNQIAWIHYEEGLAEISVKVLRDSKTEQLYLAVPTARRNGVNMRIVNYPDQTCWFNVVRDLLSFFRQSEEGRSALVKHTLVN